MPYLTGMPGLLAPQSPAASLAHPAPLATTGRIVYVSSTRPSRGDDNVGDDPSRPKATTQAAIRACRPNRGDMIVPMPGHAETLRLAGAINLSVAGVSIFGIGNGADRPTYTFESSTDASILFSAVGCRMFNVIGIPGIAGLANPFDVAANDCALNIEWQDASATLSAARAIRATNISRLQAALVYRGFAGSVSTVSGIRLNGCSHVQAMLDTYGYVSTGWVEMIGQACTNVEISGKVYTDGFTDGSHLVADTAGSTWIADILDKTTGLRWFGGSGQATSTVLFPPETAAMQPVPLNVKQLNQLLKNMDLDEVFDAVEWLRQEVREVKELTDYLVE